MREFRCDFFIDWSGSIRDLASTVSSILFPGIELKAVAEYRDEEAVLDRTIFGFTIRLDKTTGDRFCLEIIKEVDEKVEYSSEEIIGQSQLAIYVSSLLKQGGLENKFKLLEN